MTDDIRTRVMDVITGVWDHQTQIDDAAAEVIDLVCAQARAELIAEIQDRIRTMPRVRPGVYSLRDQIGAFHDGFEAGRVSALNSFARDLIPKA